jgi:hypothetical protein
MDGTSGGIYGDIMLYWVDATREWCAAYMPQQLFGYGDNQNDALLALRAALRFRADELGGYIDEMDEMDEPGRLGIVIDLGTYRRHKLAHAIQTPQSERP